MIAARAEKRNESEVSKSSSISKITMEERMNMKVDGFDVFLMICLSLLSALFFGFYASLVKASYSTGNWYDFLYFTIGTVPMTILAAISLGRIFRFCVIESKSKHWKKGFGLAVVASVLSLSVLFV